MKPPIFRAYGCFRHSNRFLSIYLPVSRRKIHTSKGISQGYDPRIADLGKIIEDDFMHLKNHYRTPKHPIVLSHGLFGFDTLQLVPWSFIPPIQYWRGINEALQANNCDVIVTAVPPSASIEKRAETLMRSIEERAGGREVNIVGGENYKGPVQRLFRKQSLNS
ncbi:hypothetical protein TWF694_009776 [Orbilia ellipsospora]|uniref:Triacylglycerol lipase n=1 Tax=Orbilia ellipsospora TaxID=2528407 RepID=A0AAV9XCU5_9PEZI